MRCVPFLAIALVSLVTRGAFCDAAKDRNALDGTWIASTAELGGKSFPADICKLIKLTIRNGKYSVTVGKGLDQGNLQLDPSASPKGMNIVGTEGPNQGKTYPAIYELNADTLRICYDLSGKMRPAEFKTTEGTQLFLVTYKREQQ